MVQAWAGKETDGGAVLGAGSEELKTRKKAKRMDLRVKDRERVKDTRQCYFF